MFATVVKCEEKYTVLKILKSLERAPAHWVEQRCVCSRPWKKNGYFIKYLRQSKYFNISSFFNNPRLYHPMKKHYHTIFMRYVLELRTGIIEKHFHHLPNERIRVSKSGKPRTIFQANRHLSIFISVLRCGRGCQISFYIETERFRRSRSSRRLDVSGIEPCNREH